MGWQRRGKHSYYYAWSKRRNGRKKVCFGRGRIAEIAEQKDAIHQAEKQAARKALCEFENEVEINNENLRELGVLVEQLVAAEMIAAGYNRQGRSRWRKRR
ncbi:MAG: hypothetical protein RIC12_00100 [Pirellulales bacterium]